MAGELNVEVAYALPDRQRIVSLTVPAGTTAAAAIELSRILDGVPELPRVPEALGIFGKQVSAETELRDGDRLEIYRPLLVDPREARRRRAAEKY